MIIGSLPKWKGRDGKISFCCYGNWTWPGSTRVTAGVGQVAQEPGPVTEGASGRHKTTRNLSRTEEEDRGEKQRLTLQPMSSAGIWSDAE